MVATQEQPMPIPDKFEALLGTDVPGATEIGKRYREAVAGLARLIDDDRHLEPQEKKLLHDKVAQLLNVSRRTLYRILETRLPI